MTKKDLWTVVRGWWQTRWLFVVGFGGFALLLGILASLFGVDRDLLSYGLLLLLVWSVVICVLDIVQAVKAYTQVQAQKSLETGTAVELYLQESLQQLEQEKAEVVKEQRLFYQHLQDYYTLWAHQMKVPLAASQLLVEDMEQGQYKNLLTQELFKIQQYTDLVLNYLRLQSFHDDLVLQEEALSDLVHAAVRKFSLFFIHDQIGLDLGDLSARLVTDKKWFGLLLEQFLSNAVKYSKGTSLSIYLDGKDLVIADRGIGISQTDLERVWERGFSGYNGRLTQQSSGLGLYLAKQIADGLGIGISLTSQVGQGTQVRLDLGQDKLSLD